MNEVPGWVTVLIGGILSGSGLASLVSYLRYRREGGTAAATEATAELNLAELVKKVAADEVATLAARLDRAEVRIDLLESGLLDVLPIVSWLDGGQRGPVPDVSAHLRGVLREIARRHRV